MVVLLPCSLARLQGLGAEELWDGESCVECKQSSLLLSICSLQCFTGPVPSHCFTGDPLPEGWVACHNIKPRGVGAGHAECIGFAQEGNQQSVCIHLGQCGRR